MCGIPVSEKHCVIPLSDDIVIRGRRVKYRAVYTVWRIDNQGSTMYLDSCIIFRLPDVSRKALKIAGRESENKTFGRPNYVFCSLRYIADLFDFYRGGGKKCKIWPRVLTSLDFRPHEFRK